MFLADHIDYVVLLVHSLVFGPDPSIDIFESENIDNIVIFIKFGTH